MLLRSALLSAPHLHFSIEINPALRNCKECLKSVVLHEKIGPVAYCRLAGAPRCVHLELIALAVFMSSYVTSMSTLKCSEAVQDGPSCHVEDAHLLWWLWSPAPQLRPHVKATTAVAAGLPCHIHLHA